MADGKRMGLVLASCWRPLVWGSAALPSQRCCYVLDMQAFYQLTLPITLLEAQTPVHARAGAGGDAGRARSAGRRFG